MSRIWAASSAQDISPVGFDKFAIAGMRGGFRALYAQAQPVADPVRAEPDDDIVALDPVEQARAEGYALGYDEGTQAMADALAAEQGARDRLAEALEHLAPDSGGTLATMLSATVVRLVEQIVGEAPIDTDLLRRRCETVAGFIDEVEGRTALYLHPDDVPLLEGAAIGVPVVGDFSMRPGSVRLDTADGWIEDGPDVRLSRLKALLDDMEGRL